MSTIIVNAALTTPGDKSVTTFELPVCLLNILVLDIRSGLPIKRTPIKWLIVNNEKYIDNGKISEDYFNACKKHVDKLEDKPINLFRISEIKKIVKIRLDLEKFIRKSVFKLKYKFANHDTPQYHLREERALEDNTDEILEELDRLNHNYCTNDDGKIIIPIRNSLFKQKITLQIGFEKFPVIAETFDQSTGECMQRATDENSETNVFWDDSIAESPDFESANIGDWGWKIRGNKKTLAKGKGNKPFDSSLTLNFKTSEKFIIDPCPVDAHLNVISQSNTSINSQVKKKYFDWVDTTFNNRQPKGDFRFNDLDHFVMFGLQACQPVWYILSDNEFSNKWFIEGDHSSTSAPIRMERNKYKGLLIPTTLKIESPGYLQAGRDYGTYFPTEAIPTPRRDDTGRRAHYGIDYYGTESVSKVFATFYGKLKSFDGTSTNGKGLGYNKCQIIKTVSTENDVEKIYWHVITYAHLPNVLANADLNMARPGQIIDRVGQTMNYSNGIMTTHGFPVHLHFQYNRHQQKKETSDRGSGHEEPWSITNSLLFDSHSEANRVFPDNGGIRLYPCDTAQRTNSASGCTVRSDNFPGPISSQCWAFKNNLCPYFDMQKYLDDLFKTSSAT